MAEIRATPQQRAAAEDRGGALLVAAAAGSGKTKVLVDRLMGYLTDPTDPADLDEFLIITYTRAAASELRGKIAARIAETIVDEPPFSVREGGFIRKGFNAEVDRLHDILSGGKGLLASIETKEKERTGIRTLKIGYNKVFGYYIEVSNSFKDQVPDTYIRKQTLVNGERYITQELKDLEQEILTAGERDNALEYELFSALRDEICANAERIQKTAAAVA